MNYRPTDLNRLLRGLVEIFEKDLDTSGVFYRIFFRAKSLESLSKKLSVINDAGEPKYDGSNKSLRDLIGIRVNLYFVDDQKIILKYIKEKYRNEFLEETVDVLSDTEFRPSRINLIFRLPQEFQQEFRHKVSDIRIEPTFELQLRTIFSEGWHEVEHDFRYKCADDWATHSSLSRTFNGMLASIETHEWSMIKLFEDLSYQHYRSSNYSAMIRMHLRIRTENHAIGDELCNQIEQESLFVKDFFKLDRALLIDFLLKSSISIPLTIDNLIYLVNYIFIGNKNISNQTPPNLLKEFSKVKSLSEERNQ